MERPWTDAERLRELYHGEGMSIYDIADEWGCGKTTIGKWLHRHDIEVDTPSHEKPPHFCTESRGYECWRHDTSGTQHKVRVHRLVAVAEYGYDEVVGKDVHHENHIPWDNRPSNISVLNRSEHAKLHNSCSSD